MTTQLTRRPPRANLRWILMAVGLTALQAAVIFTLSDRSPAQAVPHRTVPKVRVVTGDLSGLFADPRLLALPTARGFAGIGWRIASDPKPVAQDWTEPMPWLGQSETGLARTLLAAPAVGIGRGVTADKPSPQFATNALPALPLAQATIVRLAASNAPWEWIEPLVAPVHHPFEYPERNRGAGDRWIGRVRFSRRSCWKVPGFGPPISWPWR